MNIARPPLGDTQPKSMGLSDYAKVRLRETRELLMMAEGIEVHAQVYAAMLGLEVRPAAENLKERADMFKELARKIKDEALQAEVMCSPYVALMNAVLMR